MVESPGRAHADGVEAFIRRIAAAFALGEPTDWQALPDVSTNLRWDVWTPSGRYVVKQLRYPPTDDIWRRAVERAERAGISSLESGRAIGKWCEWVQHASPLPSGRGLG